MQKGYAEKGEMNRNEKVNMQKKRKEKRGNKYNFQEILIQRTHLNKRG